MKGDARRRVRDKRRRDNQSANKRQRGGEAPADKRWRGVNRQRLRIKRRRQSQEDERQRQRLRHNNQPAIERQPRRGQW